MKINRIRNEIVLTSNIIVWTSNITIQSIGALLTHIHVRKKEQNEFNEVNISAQWQHIYYKCFVFKQENKHTIKYLRHLNDLYFNHAFILISVYNSPDIVALLIRIF